MGGLALRLYRAAVFPFGKAMPVAVRLVILSLCVASLNPDAGDPRIDPVLQGIREEA
jgi:hypothetical protein